MTKIIHRLMSFLLIVNMMFYQSTPLQVFAGSDKTIFDIQLDTNGSINQGCGIGQYDYFATDLDTNWPNLSVSANADAYIQTLITAGKVPASVLVGKSYSVTEVKFAGSDLTTVCLVSPVNNPPVAVADSYTTAEDTTLNPAAPGVLGNDSDPEGLPLNAVLVSGPAHGSLTLNPDGSFTYTPASNWNGVDGFTYKANDGVQDSAVVPVQITVAPVNDPAVAVDDSASTAEETPVTIPVLANDSDVDGPALAIGSVGTPGHGTAVANPDGTILYTPALNFFGSDSFMYTLVGGGSATVRVTVSAVDDPAIAVDDSASTPEDTPIDINVLSNDSDVDGPALAIASFTAASNGTVTKNADNTMHYVPGPEFSGFDSFTYTLVGGNTATVNITVSRVDDPAVAKDDTATTLEDTPVDINVLGNDTDVDGPAPTIYSVGTPANGSVSINVDGTVHYVPDADFNGIDSFTYTLAGGSTATVTVTVTAVDDPAVAVNDAGTTSEDVAINIDVLHNDIDIDGPAPAILSVGTASNGTVTLNLDGTVHYVPNADFNGVDSFTYTLVGGSTATVTVTVTAVDDPAIAVNDNATTPEDVAIDIDVVSNDIDIDGPAPLVDTLGTASNGTVTLNLDGTVHYVPNADFNGTDSFTYTLIGGSSATVTVTVTPVNDAPVANPDTYTIDEGTSLNLPDPGILANDADVDGDTIRVAAWTPSQLYANGTAELWDTGKLVFTPNPDFNGTVSFTYWIYDEHGLTASSTVTIIVNPINDEPVANPDSYLTSMNTPLNIAAPGVLANDTDVEGDDLIGSIVGLPANGSVSLAEDGSFLYTPNTGFYGTDSFTYKVNDGQLDSNTATVTIEVTYQDQAPTAVDDSATTPVLTPITIDVLANDLNTDGGPLTVESIGTPANGSAILNEDDTVTYTPNAGFSGTDSLTYTLNGGSTATVTILVTTPPTPPVNLPPVANPLALIVAAGGSVTANVSGLDPEGIALIYALASAPASAAGAITIDPASGLFTYTHNGNGATSDSFTFTVNDYVYTTTGTVTITILQPTPPVPTNIAPVASNGSASTPFETQLNGKVVAADANGDPLTIRLDSNVANGLLVLNPDGTYSYTPNAGFSGSDSFTFIANDGTADSNTATFTITVGEEVIVTPTETPLAALPMDLSWMYWLAGLLAALMNFLAFLRPNIKYTLTTKDGTRKTLRRRLARPDSDIMFVELNDKDLQDIVSIEVMLYKRLAKHLDNVTVSFMLHNRIVHTVTIPEGQDEAYLTNIVF